MVRQTTIAGRGTNMGFLLTDDLDNRTTEGVERVQFVYKGVLYSLNLAPASQKKLEAALKPFTDAAVAAEEATKQLRFMLGVEAPKASTKRTRSTSSSAGKTPEYDKAAFKTWAVDNDVKLSRGRPARDLVDRFLAETAK